MIHGQTPESMRKEQDFPVSIEVQFLGGNGREKRSTANVCTPGTNIVMGGKLITRHCTDSTAKTYHGDQWVAIDWLVERYITTHLVSRCPTIVYYWRSVGYLWKPSHHVSYLSGVKLTFLISPAEPLIHITSSSFGLVCLGRWTPLDPVCASSGGKSGTA